MVSTERGFTSKFPLDVSAFSLSRPSCPILLYTTMDSNKMTINELKSLLRKKDFLLQVERQT
jgi:hypothetical protein